MKSSLLLAALLALAGCASTKVVTREVIVPCVAFKDVPVQPALRHDTLSPTFPLHTLYGSALADRTELLVYSAHLNALLLTCTDLQ